MAKRKPVPTVAEMKKLAWGDYLRTNHWKKLTKSMTDPEDVVCDICGAPRWNGVYLRGKKKGKRRRLRQFQCHHKHYDNMGEETREDLLILCAQCHETLHNIEKLSSHRGGTWTKLYELVMKLTIWEYIPFKDKDK